MTIINQQSIQQDQIKLRWQEPYVSAALNNKTYRTMPRGVYRGFIVTPAGGLTINVGTGGPAGSIGYQGGNFDTASARGWSIAVHENLDGYSANIIMQEGVNSSYTFDLSTQVGTNVYVGLDVQYIQGFPTTAQIKIVDTAELDSNPTIIVLAMVEVPNSGPITSPNIILDDPVYPVVYPFANSVKYGLMSQTQANIIETLDNPNVSNAFEVLYEVLVDGPQIITIPGGNEYTVNGNDLLVFKNGTKRQKGRDYLEIDRGDGHGIEVDWIGTDLRAEDRIVFRGQAYAVSLTNHLTVMDEGSSVSTGVVRMNFVGNGVSVVPDGTGRVKVLIPTSGTGGGVAASKQRRNNSGGVIGQARVVHLQSDGSIVYCDPKISNHVPYGITSGAIPDGELGTVIVSGFAINALLGIGGIVTGQVVFCSSSGTGELVIAPPDPFISNVWKIGIADCPDIVEESSPKDVLIQIQQMI